MKEKELRAHAICALCGNKILASGLHMFWRVTIERFCVDLHAVARQQGLTMMLGGNAVIAMAMGPDENMAESIMTPMTLAVCEPCGASVELPVACLAQRAQTCGKDTNG